MDTQQNPPEETGSPGPVMNPVLALAVSLGLAIGTGLLADGPAAVTVFVTTVALLGARGSRRRSDLEEP